MSPVTLTPSASSSSSSAAPAPSQAAPVSLGELTGAFLKIGLVSFGGAAAQIALMHKVIVEEKRWLDEARFRHALSYCMLLPGPEAQQLATYVGWLLHGVRGGLIAGILFILPGALAIAALSVLYVLGSHLPALDGAFDGIKAAVLAIVVHALLKIAKKSLDTPVLVSLAVAVFIALFFLQVPFPIAIIAAGAIGAALAFRAPALIGGVATPTAAAKPMGTAAGAFKAAAWCLAAWWAPIAVAALVLGGGHLLVDIGLFFSKLAVVTFGGAYAVLAYLTQEAVQMGWVTTPQMIDGLGLAETTPGPTILVNQFVAFIAGHGTPAPLSPLMMALMASLMATWATFAPSFLWIFAGAPFVDRLQRIAAITGALRGISAAVTGVLAFVSLWFALNVLFGSVTLVAWGPIQVPSLSLATLDLKALTLTVIAFAIMFIAHRGVMTTVAIMAALGVAWTLVVG
jgi:chromate transporter